MGVIPKLEARLEVSSVSDDDEALTRLHYILFGNNGSRSSRKRQIGLWRPGSSESEIKRPQIKRELVETLGTVLKEICVILGAEIGSNRSQNEEIILRALTERPVVPSSPTKPKPPAVPAAAPVKSEPVANHASPKSASKKLPGRRKGGKNNPVYQAEYAAGTRRRPGRPRQIDEYRALTEFLKRNHPSVLAEWDRMEPWVREMYDAGESIPEERIESPKKIIDKNTVSPRRGRPSESFIQRTVTLVPVVPEIVKRGRGRPRKVVRGRPAKKIEETTPLMITPVQADSPPRVKPGRPPRVKAEIRKRGRPRKVRPSVEVATAIVPQIEPPEPIKRGRGRPKKSTAAAVGPVPKRGPGRPRKYF